MQLSDQKIENTCPSRMDFSPGSQTSVHISEIHSTNFQIVCHIQQAIIHCTGRLADHLCSFNLDVMFTNCIHS